MIITTYNLRAGGRAGRRVHWQRLLDGYSPDLLLLQETLDPALYLEPRVVAAHQGRIVWQPVEGRRWGSALLVREGRVRRLEVPGFRGHVVGAEVEDTAWTRHTGRPLRVFSLHVPAPYKRPMHAILDFLATLDDTHDLILGGDFNLATGRRHVTEALPGDPPWLLERLRREFNLMSAWQTVHPNESLAQTLRWSGNPSAPYHCDGVFVPAGWYRHLDACDVVAGGDWDALSDHNPVVVTLSPFSGTARKAPGRAGTRRLPTSATRRSTRTTGPR